MLRINVERVPGAREAKAVVIGRGSVVSISNLAALSDCECAFQENLWRSFSPSPYRVNLTEWAWNERGAWEIVHATLARAMTRRHREAGASDGMPVSAPRDRSTIIGTSWTGWRKIR